MAIGAKQRSVSMLPEDVKIVQENGAPYGLDFSSSLRQIIRQWAEMRRMNVVAVGELPRPEDGQAVPVVHVQKVE